MLHEIHHVHLKSPDPLRTAQWYVEAFDFRIVGDAVRPSGDRFIRCQTAGGMPVNISGGRDGEAMNQGDSDAHWGLEHFGIAVLDLKAEIERLELLGAKVIEGPTLGRTGRSVAFIEGPDSTRIELVEVEPAP